MTPYHIPTIPTFPNQVKRSSECTQNSTYTISASVFSISCDSEWAWWDALYITFTRDFQSCMTACVDWNSHSQDTCRGVSWTDGTYGPSGVSEGSECVFYWATTTSFQTNGTDSAQLQTLSTATVPPSLKASLTFTDDQLDRYYTSCSTTHRNGMYIQ